MWNGSICDPGLELRLPGAAARYAVSSILFHPHWVSSSPSADPPGAGNAPSSGSSRRCWPHGWPARNYSLLNDGLNNRVILLLFRKVQTTYGMSAPSLFSTFSLNIPYRKKEKIEVKSRNTLVDYRDLRREIEENAISRAFRKKTGLLSPCCRGPPYLNQKLPKKTEWRYKLRTKKM